MVEHKEQQQLLSHTHEQLQVVLLRNRPEWYLRLVFASFQKGKYNISEIRWFKLLTECVAVLHQKCCAKAENNFK